MGCGSSFATLPSIVSYKETRKSIKPKQERLENFEPFTLICLDENFDENDEELRSIVDYICCFNDIQQCEEFILNNNNNHKNDHLFFIISIEYVTNIISHIHDLQQIIAIYILQQDNSDRTNNIIDSKWTKRYAKVKGIYLDRDTLLEDLSSDVKLYTNIGDLLPITVYSRSDTHQNSDSSHDHLRFLFYQLFINEYCLNSTSLNKSNLIDIIKDYYINEDQINELNKDYHSSKNALTWFINNSFLRRLLTKSLLILNLKILFALRFFIKDIHKTMIDHKSQISKEQIFYRSQVLSEETFGRIKSNTGGLLSINNLFLVNENRHDSLAFIRQNVPSTKFFYRILFEITIPSDYKFQKQRPFIDITRFSSDKYTTLFFIGSIFQINSVVFDINNDCWIIQLTLYDETITDNDFSDIFTFINNNTNSVILANLLRQISPDSAEQFYKHILKENSQSFSKTECYRGLGLCSYSLHDYEQALIYFQKALETNPNDELIKSSVHNSIGLVYAKQNDVDQAHIHFSEALQNSSVPLHIACIHHNLALIYSKQGLFNEELDHYQEAFQIRTEQLPENHLQIASLFNNIGVAYTDIHEYDKALLNLRKGLEIRLRLLSENHTDVARSFVNIGVVYVKTGEFPMALDYFDKAQVLFEKQQPIPEQDILQVQKNIKIVNDKLRRKTC